jgi:predicted nucleotidyltransferase
MSGAHPQFAPQPMDGLQLLLGGVTVVDDGIHGWNVPEIREAVFRRSEERAELVKADAIKRAHRIADLLRTRYSASAVTLYGSLSEACFHDRSDIDILVEGFRGDYWEMYVTADEIAGPFDLSVVCIEDAADTLIEHARERVIRI